jgi:signal transduction histidine kinase
MSASRVCIVDDDRIARDTSAALLAPDRHELLTADSGQDLLTRLPELEPDVILLDVMMPGMDGFEVCRRLKGDARWRHIPIILVTALDSREDLIRGLDAGADEFLAKPVYGPELRARVRSMLRIKQQYDQVQATLRLRQDLANMVVHDMRVPLGAASLYCQLLLRRGTLSAQDRQDFDVIEGQVHRLDDFVNDLLQMAKMEAGQLLLQRSPVDVRGLITGLGEVHAAVARFKGIDLHFELPEKAPAVALDGSLFGRMVDNLLSNALKFSGSGTRVVLRLRFYEGAGRDETAPQLRLEVRDQGSGIPEDQTEKIFEQFETVDTPEHYAQQLGLGLAFAKQVVEAHGGTLRVSRNEPQGSVFTVEL